MEERFRYFMETATKSEIIELLKRLRDLHKPSLNGFINTLEKTI